MSTIQFGFVLPSEGRDKQNRPTLVEDMNKALDLITGHFDSAWMIDHLQCCEPRPVPPPPIMIGAFKPKMLRLTAKYADW